METAFNRQSAKAPKPEPDRELDVLAHQVIGAAIEVHKVLGPGYKESVYQTALAIGIPHQPQPPFPLRYKGYALSEGRADFLVGNRLVVELKAVDKLASIHKAQLISYLKATGHVLGLLINFNEALLPDGIKRVILS